jgi:predicted ATP-grasp superfamily ATP-dependent carboligase
VLRNAAALGLRPTVVARPGDVSLRSRLGRRVLLERPIDEDALAVLHAQAEPGDRPALVATNDRWLRLIVAHRAEIDGRFAVLHPSNTVLETCLDKRRFAEWAQEQRLPTPPLVDIDGRAASLPFPLMIRPRSSNVAWSTAVPKASAVRDADDLRATVGRFDAAGAPWIATRSLLDEACEQYSVAVAVNGGVWLSFVAQKLRPLPDQCAVGTCVTLRRHPGAEMLARRVLSLMGFGYGVAEVEMIGVRNGELLVIEVNPRPWTQFALSYRSRHDMLAFLLQSRPVLPSRALREGLAWIDLTNDLFTCFSRTSGLVRRGRLTLAEYARSLSQARVFSRFALRDPYPAVHHWVGMLRRRRR